MTMSTLMCPHCGGRLLIDTTMRLQSMLTCPYCARKSLMQKKNGMIVLRGIIATNAPSVESVAETPSSETIGDTADETVTTDVDTANETGTTELTLEPDAEPAVGSDTEPAVDPIVEPEAVSDANPNVEPDLELEAEHLLEPTDIAPVQAAMVETILEEIPMSFEPANLSEEPTVTASEPENLAVEQDEPDQAAVESIQAGQATALPVAQSLLSAQEAAAAFEEKAAPVEEAKSSAEPESRQKHLIALAIRAADDGSIMAFNSYARQAIDCDPTNPQMYALRSRLIEMAHGFARATFLSPVWMSYTPRQKAFTIAQHFSSFNAAVRYSAESEKTVLADEAGRLIAWQVREAFIENARLRLGKRAFNGKFRRQDLGTAPRVIDSLRCVNETVVPQVADELLRSIRSELDKLDPKLYYQLMRSGF